MNNLTQSDILKMRLVSPSWKHMVDSAYHFDAVIDDRKHNFTGKCSLAMRKCHLKSLVGSHNRFVFDAPYPEQVTIHFRICQWNLGEMCRKWTNLTKLRLCWRPFINSYLFKYCPKPNSVKNRKYGGVQEFFPHMKCLGLSLFTSFNKTDPTVLQNLTYFLSWDFEKLRHFSVSLIILNHKSHACNLPSFVFVVVSFCFFVSITIFLIRLQYDVHHVVIYNMMNIILPSDYSALCGLIFSSVNFCLLMGYFGYPKLSSS